jgi:hypothetical protein
MQTNPMTEEAAIDMRITVVYSAIKGDINWDNIVPTLLVAAEMLEMMTELSGPQKLDLLQKTLKHALKESKLSAVEKEQALHTIETVVPIVIQGAIMASKYPIGRAVAQAVRCCWMK